MSSHCIRVRGVMREYAVWSLMRKMRSTMSCSVFSNVPSSVPCSMRSLTSSSVTVSSMCGFMPKRKSTAFADEEKKSTSGRERRSKAASAWLCSARMRSGSCRAIFFGMNSPKSRLRYVTERTLTARDKP